MNKTDLYCFVADNTAKAPPEGLIFNPEPVRSNPFVRPTRVGDTIIGEKATDAALEEKGVYRLWQEEHEQPEDSVFVEDVPTMVKGKLVRRERYRRMNDEELKQQELISARDRYDNAMHVLREQSILESIGIDSEYSPEQIEGYKNDAREAIAILRQG